MVVEKGRRKDIPLWYAAVVRGQVRNSLSMLYILGSIRKIVSNEVQQVTKEHHNCLANQQFVDELQF